MPDFPRATPAWIVTTATGIEAQLNLAIASGAPIDELDPVDRPDTPVINNNPAIPVERNSGPQQVRAQRKMLGSE